MSDPIADLKYELLAAAERQQRHAAAGAGRVLGLPLRRHRILLAVTVAIAAAAALFVNSPWETAPGFLERVRAAVAPAPGSILYVKWERTSTSSDLACTVTYGPNEIWIDQTPPHRYRVLLNEENFGAANRRTRVCSRGTVAELGGTLDPDWTPRPPSLESGRSRPTLRFVPPNTLSSSYANWPFNFPRDPVQDLRTGLSTGRAHDEGTMQLDGRTVRRIRIDPPSDCPVSDCPRKPTYAYVDPETFYPIQTECEDCGGIAVFGRRVRRFDIVTRYLTYEPNLPRTAANLALTDIRAQHPGATRAQEPGLLFLPTLSGAVAKTVRAAKGAKSARVTFDVTAAARDGSDVPVSCLPRSGSRFLLGETIVSCEASDAWGSTNTADFTVTVTGRR